MDGRLFDQITGRIEEIISQSPFPEDIFHSINTLEWVLKLAPQDIQSIQDKQGILYQCNNLLDILTFVSYLSTQM
jgi:hypothetical protein